MKKPPAPPLASPDAPLANGLRQFLYFTAAMTGAAILIVEILGAKLLSPYLGTSHFVWTAQIAVTLVSLAVGYYFGGWLVDRSPRLSRLYWCILAAAAYLGLTVLLVRPVAYGCLQFRLALGSLLASLFLFFVPLTLLATTGPFLVRVLTQSVQAVGGQVGRLSAVSTLGSVAGTLLIGYLLIPFLPNSITMFLTAAMLCVVCAAYFFIWGRRQAPPAAVTLLILGGLGLGYAGVARDLSPDFIGAIEFERRNSNFGQLQVLQYRDGDTRYYLNDYLVQNTYDIRTKQSVSLFTYMLHGLATVYTPKLESVLCIGLGVGIVPMEFAREGVNVDVVEINGAVVPLAAKHFGLQPEKLHITIADGRQFLNECRKQYDAVVLDAFLGDSSPSHLMTREAFTAIGRVLTPEGVLVINSFGDFQAGHDFLTASLEKTLKAAFRSVKIHDGANGNVFFVASNRPELEFRRPPDSSAAHPMVQANVAATYTRLAATDPRHGRVLTDDFNPVEFHDAANRERMRRYLARSVKEM